MTAKDIVKEVVENFKYSFGTDAVVNELTTRKANITRGKVIKSLKELGYKFNRTTKIWEKLENIKLKKPQLGRVYIPEIHFAIIHRETRQVLEKKNYLLGVFFDEKEALAYSEKSKKSFVEKANEIENSNSVLEVLVTCLITKTIGNMNKNNLIFQIN